MKEILFDNERDVKDAIASLKASYRLYESLLVSDVYDLVAMSTTLEDSLYGWKNIDFDRQVYYEIDNERNKYILKMPAEVRLKSPSIRSGRYPWGADMVSHPPHYQSETGMEVIDVIEAFTFDLKGIEATDTGNIIKYICRWKNKNGLQDLEKAKWYLEHLIKHVKTLEKEND